VPTVGAKKKKWFAIARIVLFENLLTNDWFLSFLLPKY
jgi:hypothetical protein